MNATTLKAMKAAGVTIEQIIAIAEAEDIANQDRLMAARERERLKKRRQRETKRSTETKIASRVSLGTMGDTPSLPPAPSPSPDKEIPPAPPKENNLFLFSEPPSQPRVSGVREIFENRFWKRFPNKVGKADASKAFSKALTRIDIETMMIGLERYASKTDDRPWCNPATWLNQDRWTDAPAQTARASPVRRMTKAEELGEQLREKYHDKLAAGREGGGDIHPPQRLLAAGGKAGS